MYCNRMEDILKQLDEVIKERDKVIKLTLLCVLYHMSYYIYNINHVSHMLNVKVLFSINKAISSREEYHQENCKNLQDKDRYRKQLRELGEHYDELQVQLFRTQGEILTLQAKLRRQKHFHKILGVSSHVICRT